MVSEAQKVFRYLERPWWEMVPGDTVDHAGMRVRVRDVVARCERFAMIEAVVQAVHYTGFHQEVEAYVVCFPVCDLETVHVLQFEGVARARKQFGFYGTDQRGSIVCDSRRMPIGNRPPVR
jgi:hypothetical protein